MTNIEGEMIGGLIVLHPPGNWSLNKHCRVWFVVWLEQTICSRGI